MYIIDNSCQSHCWCRSLISSTRMEDEIVRFKMQRHKISDKWELVELPGAIHNPVGLSNYRSIHYFSDSSYPFLQDMLVQ